MCKDDEQVKNKYTLCDPIDLRSRFLLEVDAKNLEKAKDNEQLDMEQKLEELKILEKLPDDEYRGNRRHAWVVILSNVEWAAKKSAGPHHQFDNVASIQPFFIEPSTGSHFSADDSNYFAIDSVWNEGNYYVSYCEYLMCFSPHFPFSIEHMIRFSTIIAVQVNLQGLNEDGVQSIKWDLENPKNWQVLLNENSVVDFEKRSETPDQLKSANINFCARYLDMPTSWLKQFSVTNAGK